MTHDEEDCPYKSGLGGNWEVLGELENEIICLG